MNCLKCEEEFQVYDVIIPIMEFNNDNPFDDVKTGHIHRECYSEPLSANRLKIEVY